MFVIVQWYGTWFVICACAYLIAGEIYIWRSRYMADVLPLFFWSLISLCLAYGSVGVFLMFLAIFGSEYWQVEIRASNWLGLFRMYLTVSGIAVLWLIMRVVNYRAVRRTYDEQQQLREVLRMLATSKEKRVRADGVVAEAQAYLIHNS